MASRIALSSLSSGTILHERTFLPAAGTQAYVYAHGTTTPVTVYVAEVGGSTLTQPLVADGNGQLPGWVVADQVDDIVVDGVASPIWPVDGSGGVGGGIYTVTAGGNLGATPSFTPAAGLTALTGTLNANCALTITPATGDNILLLFAQDGTGSRTLTINGASITIPSAASASFVISCTYDGTNLWVTLLAGFTGSAAGGDLSGTYPAPTVAKLNGVVASSYVTLTGTQTLTNKRITNRVVTVTQSATPTINTDNTDVASITGLAQAITSMTTNLSGTPGPFDPLLVAITDDGTARAISWGAKFEASTVALPTTTVASTLLIVEFVWNAVTSKLRCVGVA